MNQRPARKVKGRITGLRTSTGTGQTDDSALRFVNAMRVNSLATRATAAKKGHVRKSELHDAILSVVDLEQLNAVQERQVVEQNQIAAIRRRLGSGIQRLISEEGF
jgi:hypothetical protein